MTNDLRYDNTATTDDFDDCLGRWNATACARGSLTFSPTWENLGPKGYMKCFEMRRFDLIIYALPRILILTYELRFESRLFFSFASVLLSWFPVLFFTFHVAGRYWTLHEEARNFQRLGMLDLIAFL
ncbi:hypothetical protein HDV57DRAFT_332151 [Trichoderma longibrachiatum]|uniref:Uncharacterized protein n=1 Tax=Trichoderma longibrachiatum ATCC 18648 TaxID=983965 RepID=A0A2T4BVH7_TRILO|nr:hypothetical protein M440DRAFT_1059997 [Trichoderma longibrachiatum ATCC 18648]